MVFSEMNVSKKAGLGELRQKRLVQSRDKFTEKKKGKSLFILGVSRVANSLSRLL